MRRVAAIAIDAAEWSFMERFMDAGQLPELARLRDRSRRALLDNVVPYRSELPWTQFLTGRDAKANGYWSTETFDPSEYHPYCQGAYLGDPFYADQPIKAIVLDPPHASLSPRVDGLQVLAWGSHGPQYPRASLPAGLLTEMDEKYGPHPAFDNDFDVGWYSQAYITTLTDALVTGAHARMDIARDLQRRLPDWNLLLMCMSEVHSAGHHFWHGVDAAHPLHTAPTAPLAANGFLKVAEAVDEAVGRFVAELPDDTVTMVFALHGMLPADDLASMVLLPEVFHRLQFGRALLRTGDAARWERDGRPFVLPDSDHAWAVMNWVRHHFLRTPKDWTRAALHRALPDPVFQAARRLAGKPRAYRIGELLEPIPPETTLTPEEIAEQHAARKPLDWQPTAWYRPYWPRMRYFALPTFTDAHVRINLVGRERDGIVATEEYERTCDEVIEVVSKLRDPRTGKPVLGDVLRMRADDPFDPDGPDADLLLVWNVAVDAVEHPDLGVIGPVPYMRTGAHTSNGFALFSGEGIEPGDIGEHSATTLPPTILELLGLPAPDGTLGTSLASHLRAGQQVP